MEGDASRLDTAYSSIKDLATFAKIFGAFPLRNAWQHDGRKLQHVWLDKIHVWDLILCTVSALIFSKCCVDALTQSQDHSDESHQKIWITLTYFIAAMRGMVQFILLHCYSPRLPRLFTKLEEYHQEIGKPSIKPINKNIFTDRLSIIRIFLIVILLELLSFAFVSTLENSGTFLNGWPIIILFIFSNLWQELPMNLLVVVCMYVTRRLDEIRVAISTARVEKDVKDVAETMEMLRLQHAALTRVVSELQKCYGLQVAVNIFFLLVEIVLQMYVFFVVTLCENLMLVVLSLYYFVMAVMQLAFVDQLQRKDSVISEEIAAFSLHKSSHDLQIQVQLFSAQLATRPVVFSASGYFTLNNSLVASILGSVATYLVVLIQFAPYLHDLLQPNITLSNNSP